MLLQPRIFKYKKIQKRRSIIFFKSNNKLKFGDNGLLLLKTIQLSSNHLLKFKLFLKKAIKKRDKTKRFFWFNSFPHLPLTKKSTGSRMGKGKGKLKCWHTNIKSGVFLIEFINLRFGRSKYFFKQIVFKLGIKAKLFYLNKRFINYPFSKKKTFFNIFW